MSSVHFRRNGPLVSAAILAAMIGATSSLTQRAAAAPDNTLGMALMAATVAGNATLIRGAGVVAVGRGSGAKGDFVVTFDRSLANCTCTATLMSAFESTIAAICPRGDQLLNQVEVVTWFQAQAFDLAFHLIVFCPK
jgi:hypothetical protein